MNRIAVTTECVADLPDEMLKERGIQIIYFDIETDGGMFRDTQEVHTMDILEYMSDGIHKAKSYEATPRDYRMFFEDILKEYDEIIHICISSKVAIATDNASIGKIQMGMKGMKVHVVDSGHLSAGQGYMALLAAEMAKNGDDAEDILAALEALKPKLVTSFITRNADFLYYNGRTSERIMKICRKFSLHPVLCMKDGELSLKGVRIGRYDRACSRYLRSTLQMADTIDTRMGFLIHAGCGTALLNHIKAGIEKHVHFDRLIVNYASATVSCNCGPEAFGVLFIRK